MYGTYETINGTPAAEIGGNMGEISQNVAQGNGVVTAHDAGILWGDGRYNNMGHAINATGLEYDANGKLKNVVVNDTGTGKCAQKIPARQFRRSLWPGANSIATTDPVWGRP